MLTFLSPPPPHSSSSANAKSIIFAILSVMCFQASVNAFPGVLFIMKQLQLANCSLELACGEFCAAKLARLYVQTRVSGHKILLCSRITSLTAVSVPVISVLWDHLSQLPLKSALVIASLLPRAMPVHRRGMAWTLGI